MFVSVKWILGKVLETNISPLATILAVVVILPVVDIACDPKSGEIFVPAIAALAFISAFTIAPSTIFALVTLLSAGSLTPRLLNVRMKSLHLFLERHPG